MSVPQYTTPTFLLTFDDDDLDLTTADHVYVTFRALECRKEYLLTKTGDDLNVKPQSISVFLSQEETADLGVGNIEIQANWTQDGKRAASEVVPFTLSKQLLRRVVA